MYSEMEKNTQNPANEPPMPPPAQFDQDHVITAKPVQLLSFRQRSIGALQRIFGPHVIAVALVVAGSVIGFTVATSALDASPVESANRNDTVAPVSATQTEGANVAGEVESETADMNAPELAPPVQNTFTQPIRRVRRIAPPMAVRRGIQSFEFDEDSQDQKPQDQKPKPRLVSIIH